MPKRLAEDCLGPPGMTTPSTDRKKRPRRPCPRCHCGLRRVRRKGLDHLRALFQPRLARYKCLATGCSWEGLLPRRRRSRRSAAGPVPASAAEAFSSRSQMLQGIAGAMLLATVALAAAAAYRWVAPGVDMVEVGPRKIARGSSHDGDQLPRDHPLLLAASPIDDTDEVEPAATPASTTTAQPAEQPLGLRRHCAWGTPGRNPYQGSVELALRTARLPESLVQRIAADVKERRITDRISIGNGSIRADASGRRFDPARLALTFGRTLCVDARVNFAKGHVERADLYEAQDSDGKVVAVMVPDVCGNVSVLSEVAVDDDTSAADAARQEGRNTALRRLPSSLIYEGPGRGSGSGLNWAATPERSHEISTPTTLACTLLAGVAAAWASRRRRRGRSAQSAAAAARR